jgi:hypothetical protein
MGITPSVKRGPVAVANVKRLKKMLDFIDFIKILILNFTANAVKLPAPDPAVPLMTTDNDDLETLNTLSRQRVPGAAASRNVQYKKVKSNMWSWLRYVQGLADAMEDETAAIEIIELAGFSVRVRGVRIKAPIAAINGQDEGVVILRARATKRASYEWQQSTDGTTWTTVSFTTNGHAIINNLTPGQKYFFRVRPILSAGPQIWTTACSIYAK